MDMSYSGANSFAENHIRRRAGKTPEFFALACYVIISQEELFRV